MNGKECLTWQHQTLVTTHVTPNWTSLLSALETPGNIHSWIEGRLSRSSILQDKQSQSGQKNSYGPCVASELLLWLSMLMLKCLDEGQGSWQTLSADITAQKTSKTGQNQKNIHISKLFSNPNIQNSKPESDLELKVLFFSLKGLTPNTTHEAAVCNNH